MKKRQVVMLRRVDSSAAAGYGNGGSGGGASPASSNNYNNNNVVSYAECLKNHAANSGGYALDGCREFMASAGEGTSGALICAACGCHRNFHRRKELANAAAPTR